MIKHTVDERLTSLAPVPERLDQQWADQTLARILADEPPARPRRRISRPLAAVAVAGALTLSAGAAVAIVGDDPIHTVKDALLGFQDEPNTTGNDVGTIHDPQLVAQFTRSNGDVFAVWIATTSSGAVCSASSGDGWDGQGSPSPSQLEYGCGGQIVDPTNPDRAIPLERPDQLGGFFKDLGGPIVYGVSPYPGTVEVHVEGQGVDRTLPVRADSLGYGTNLPGAGHATSLTLTYLDAAGHALGTRTVVAPIG